MIQMNKLISLISEGIAFEKIIYCAFFFFSFPGYANESSVELETLLQSNFINNGEIEYEMVSDAYLFSGLARYFNTVVFYIVSDDKAEVLQDSETYELERGDWLAIAGRFKVLLVKQEGIKVQLENEKLRVLNADSLQEGVLLKIVEKTRLATVAPVLDKIRYFHLWPPLAFLAAAAEQVLEYIHRKTAINWVCSLLIFSLLIKVVLYPVTRYTKVVQDNVNALRARLEPEIAEIKLHFDGEAAHHKIMDVYKELGVTPFFSLRPMLVALIQLPILIAVFNALGEMPQLRESGFFWIESLAYPDTVGTLPIHLPMLGSQISLLPFIMSALTLLLIFLINDRSQKLNVIFMSLGFLVLFYPFPAALVLYWALANFWHLIATLLDKMTSS